MIKETIHAAALINQFADEVHDSSASRQGIHRINFRQPARFMRMALESPAIVSLNGLDSWLQSALEINYEPCLCLFDRHGQSALANHIIDLAWRCLLVTRALLNATGVPAFDPGGIVQIQPVALKPSQWQVVIRLAHIDEIPEACYNLALQTAIQTVCNRLNAAAGSDNSAHLLQTMEKLAILPMKQMVISGKSTIPLLSVAYGMDIPFIHLVAGIYQLGWGRQARRFDRSISEADSLIGAKVAQHKAWSARLLRRAGLPSPEHGLAASEKEAVNLAHQLGWPLIVKPADLDRGEGISTGINDDNALLDAFRLACGKSKIKQVIIEREVPGVCHRLLVANGRLLFAVKRLPKLVRGDGQKSVADLIRSANLDEQTKAPWLRSEHFPDDVLAQKSMKKYGFTLVSIPDQGVLVPLRPVESTQWGGEDEDVTACVHPDNRALALRASSLFGLNVAGIDIISVDIASPWHVNNAIINEVNVAPLLGGGPLTTKYIQAFLKDMIAQDGRIPIEVFVGGEKAMAEAKKRRSHCAQSNRQCFLTSHQLTLDAFGAVIPLTLPGLFQRCRALLVNRQVEEIVLVIQTDECLDTGLPVDRFTRVTVSDRQLTSVKNPGQGVPSGRIDALLNIINAM